jgi:hypothetical protein
MATAARLPDDALALQKLKSGFEHFKYDYLGQLEFKSRIFPYFGLHEGNYQVEQPSAKHYAVSFTDARPQTVDRCTAGVCVSGSFSNFVACAEPVRKSRFE